MPSNCDPTFKNFVCMLTYINCTKVVYFTWWFHYGVFYMYITHFGYQPHPHDPHLPHFHCCSLYSLQVLLWFSCLSKKSTYEGNMQCLFESGLFHLKWSRFWDRKGFVSFSVLVLWLIESIRQAGIMVGIWPWKITNFIALCVNAVSNVGPNTTVDVVTV